jgi:hypothetical protein
MEAALIVAALERGGIRATTTGEATAGFRAEAPGSVQVLVAERDLPRAYAVLGEMRQAVDEIDWVQVDVGEPEGESLPETTPWWIGFSLWRRVAFVIVNAYLLWVLANIAVSFARLLLREMGI